MLIWLINQICQLASIANNESGRGSLSSKLAVTFDHKLAIKAYIFAIFFAY